MKEYTRHHYIPQFILRNFCESDEKMYIANHIIFDLQKFYPKEVFMVENLYDYAKDVDIKQIEKDFNRFVEKPASDIIARLIKEFNEAKKLPSRLSVFAMNRKELYILKKFFVATKFRTEANMSMYLDQNITGKEMSSYNIEKGESKLDFWKRELKYIIENEWIDILKKKTLFSVTVQANEIKNNYFGIFYSDEEFVISDIGLVSERNYITKEYIDKDLLMKGFNKLEEEFGAKKTQDINISDLMKEPYLDNFVILPVSPKIALVSISPFWKAGLYKKFLKVFKIRTGMKREYLLQPKNIYVNREKMDVLGKSEYNNIEKLLDMNDQFIYKINYLNTDESILLNTLMMNESMKYVGLRTPEKVLKSFVRYVSDNDSFYCVSNKKRLYNGFPGLIRRESTRK